MTTSQRSWPDFDAWNDPDEQYRRLSYHIAEEDRERLDTVYHLALRTHEGQWRHSAAGTDSIPYIVHPIRVARIMAEEWQRTDRRILMTCLLHDVIEDGPPQIAQEIAQIVGKEVYEAVWQLTKPVPGPAEVKASRDARYFSELRVAPEWVRLIKCADRVDNLRDARFWGDPAFWERYSSETIGWHLFLARETAPIAEVALFKALVEGERTVRGRVPVWADGHLIDPTAAALIPEHIARNYGAIGLALQGDTLFVGMADAADMQRIKDVALTTGRNILPITVTAEAIRDALAAGLYGRIGDISAERT